MSDAYFPQLWHDTLQGQTCPGLDRQRAPLCDRGHPKIKRMVASSSVHQTSAQDAVEWFLASCLVKKTANQNTRNELTIETLTVYATTLSLKQTISARLEI